MLMKIIYERLFVAIFKYEQLTFCFISTRIQQIIIVQNLLKCLKCFGNWLREIISNFHHIQFLSLYKTVFSLNFHSFVIQVLFNAYGESLMRLGKRHKCRRRLDRINNLRSADDTTLLAANDSYNV